MLIYPAIDLRGGRCVRLLKGDYARETRYRNDPAALARDYLDVGARWIHVVDLDGARRGEFANLAAIESIVATGARVQAGGGIRSGEDLERLFDAGVDRAVIGSLAVREPALVADWLIRHGGERVCLALDIRIAEGGQPMLATAGWTEDSGTSLDDGIAAFAGTPLQHVLCTDIDRDGTLSGPATEFYRSLVAEAPELRIQASGGVSALADLEALAGTGVAGVITGRAILEGKLDLQEALRCWPAV